MNSTLIQAPLLRPQPYAAKGVTISSPQTLFKCASCRKPTGSAGLLEGVDGKANP